MTDFALDVLEGLSSNPKYLSSKYFYDDEGSRLFRQIMESPEYYLTNAEMEIFRERSSDVIKSLAFAPESSYDIVELGAGDGSKTIHLLTALESAGISFRYIPIDISAEALDVLVARMSSDAPQINVLPMEGDYFEILKDLKKSAFPKAVLFLGSNIGNLTDDKSSDFIYGLGAHLRPGDKILLGVDLKKSTEIVLPAYNDQAGVTAAFNLNLLRRINRELGADFDLSEFIHSPTYDETEGVARSYLVSKSDQKVAIEKIGKTFSFMEGEKITTEISRKYDDGVIAKIISKTDFEVTATILDSKELFADYVLTRK